MQASKLRAATASGPSDAMVLQFNTSLGSSTVRLPLKGTVSVVVTWGDGLSDTYTTTGTKTHTYATAGTYTVRIVGTLTGFGENFSRPQLTRCLSFGNLGLTDLSRAFQGCFNLTEVPDELPPGVTNLSFMFSGTDLFNQDISGWNTSSVTNMDSMFNDADAFNQSLNGWDTSSVTNMQQMFARTAIFNGDISAWDTSSVTSMYQMFYFASAFNQPIGSWDTSSVTGSGFSFMFYEATAFNQSLNGWNVSGATDLSWMFFGADAFNGDISSWNVSNVTNMVAMFWQATAFNGNIGSWNVSNVTSMDAMLSDTSFNQNIGSWNVSNVVNMTSLFSGAPFNQNIGSWNVSKVESMAAMFSETPFNQNIGSWNTSAVTNMGGMFFDTTAFNQNISGWDTSNVLNMAFMFEGATAFNQNIGAWDVSSVANMQGMFSGAPAFNQDIGGWATANVSIMSNMFQGATVFNQDLSNWCVGNIPAEPLNFSTGSALTTGNKPVWGTCPSFVADGSITYIGQANGIESATLPAHQAGDLILAFAFRDGSTTFPTLPTGWTSIDTAFASVASARLAYKVAASSSETTGTWFNATTCIFLVYRGVNITDIDLIDTESTGTGTTVTYNANGFWQGLSRLVAFAGHQSTDTALGTVPGDLTLIVNPVDATDEAAAFQSTVDNYGNWTSTNVSVGGTSSGWITFTMRLRVPITPAP